MAAGGAGRGSYPSALLDWPGLYTGPTTDEADEQYAGAVAEAVRRGINLIDCAINYRHMRSERALGAGLKRLFDSGEASRDEVFVMSKAGYIPFDGEVPRDRNSFIRDTYVERGILRPNEIVAGCHSIAPSYLADQFERSLNNFGFDALDVYFLHNVEQQLEEVAREEFDRRVRAAFRYLESEVEKGRLGFYGAATWNGFRVPPENAEHLSLERLDELATEVVGPGHHFRVLQLPFNLAMPEALTQPTQKLHGQRVSFLEAAYALGMLTVTSVPLMQTQILPHLPANFAPAMPELSTGAQRAIQFARSTPGVYAPLVGMKQKAHVVENAEVARHAPMDEESFARLISGE
ncbi:MAG: aldo/keto reductase [Candidatus Eisenbacteria bacterium]